MQSSVYYYHDCNINTGEVKDTGSKDTPAALVEAWHDRRKKNLHTHTFSPRQHRHVNPLLSTANRPTVLNETITKEAHTVHLTEHHKRQEKSGNSA